MKDLEEESKELKEKEEQIKKQTQETAKALNLPLTVPVINISNSNFLSLNFCGRITKTQRFLRVLLNKHLRASQVKSSK